MIKEDVRFVYILDSSLNMALFADLAGPKYNLPRISLTGAHTLSCTVSWPESYNMVYKHLDINSIQLYFDILNEGANSTFSVEDEFGVEVDGSTIIKTL